MFPILDSYKPTYKRHILSENCDDRLHFIDRVTTVAANELDTAIFVGSNHEASIVIPDEDRNHGHGYGESGLR